MVAGRGAYQNQLKAKREYLKNCGHPPGLFVLTTRSLQERGLDVLASSEIPSFLLKMTLTGGFRDPKQ